MVTGFTAVTFGLQCLRIAKRGDYPRVRQPSAAHRLALFAWAWWLAAVGVFVVAMPLTDFWQRLLLGSTVVGTAMIQLLRFVRLQAVAMIDQGAELARSKMVRR